MKVKKYLLLFLLLFGSLSFASPDDDSPHRGRHERCDGRDDSYEHGQCATDPSNPGTFTTDKAVYSNGILYIPNIEVKVMDPFSRQETTLMYEAELQLVPNNDKGGPMRFELIRADLK